MKSPLLQRNGFWQHLSDARRHFAQSTEAMVDPIGVVMPIVRSWQAWVNHPAELLTASTQMLSDLVQLNANAWSRLNGARIPPDIEPDWFDQRFTSPAWKEEAGWESLLEQYLYWSRAYERLIEETPGMDHAERRKAAFWFKKYAMPWRQPISSGSTQKPCAGRLRRKVRVCNKAWPIYRQICRITACH